MDVKYVCGSNIGYTVPKGVYEVKDFYLMLKSLLSDEVKVHISVDDYRLKSNLTTNETTRLLEKKLFFHYFRFYGITLGDNRWYSRFCLTDSSNL